MGKRKSSDTVVQGKHEGKRPLGRPGRRWEDVDWINQAQNTDKWWAVVNTVMNLRVT
jgi:hypothetical protein